MISKEIWQKGNTSKAIPKAPRTAPVGHIHKGTAIILSNAVQALSGIESAESIMSDVEASRQRGKSYELQQRDIAAKGSYSEAIGWFRIGQCCK